MVTFNSIKKAHFVSSLIKKKTALHNLNKQRPKEFPMQKCWRLYLTNLYICQVKENCGGYLPSFKLICHLIYLLILTGYFILIS